MEQLKYTNMVTSVQIFKTGLQTIDSINEIYSGSINRKVIIRIDLMPELECYMSSDTISGNREYLLNLAKGLYPISAVRNIVTTILDGDQKFRSGINVLFDKCPYEMSFGEFISQGLADVLLEKVQVYNESTRGTEVFVIGESDGYLYLSVPDEEGYKVPYSKYEVISKCKRLVPYQ